MTDRVPCRTPTGTSATNIPAWKFDACREAVLATLADGETKAKDMTDRVRDRLTEAQLAEMGKLGWHVTAVRLEMEVREEIARVPGLSPVTLRLATPRGAAR